MSGPNPAFWKKLLFSTGLLLLSLLFAYGLTILYRTPALYRHDNGQTRGWRNPVFRPDDKLGWVPVPGAQSAHTFPIGPDIPTQFDADAFRIPADGSRTSRNRPLILALGCSFTYGDACLAEDTFPHQVAQTLGGTELNAGVCSYGLAQMLLLAEELIPRFTPDYVLIQYSPWLFDRSAGHFAPTYFSFIFNPFFADTLDGDVEICPPALFNAGLNLSPRRSARDSVCGLAVFVVRRALPLFVYSDIALLSYRIRHTLGLIKPPSQNRAAVLQEVYGRIRKLCYENGAHPLIVVIGDSVAPVSIPAEITGLDMPLVNAQESLIAALPEPTPEAYHQAYAHFRGSPPTCVDGHPNPRAHALIATAIVEQISTGHKKYSVSDN